MANTNQPNTNGSQFFITTVPPSPSSCSSSFC
jgi:cyclophilin family peptidyl-prolyl cis-trans isomerase